MRLAEDRTSRPLPPILEFGLGVALMVSHQHGLKHGHIPLTRDDQGRPAANQVLRSKTTRRTDLFMYLLGLFDRTTRRLKKLGIFNRNPRRSKFIYHEDGLIGAFSFDKKVMSQKARSKSPSSISATFFSS